jgi:hypothetical protein
MKAISRITALLMLAFPLAGQTSQPPALFDPLGTAPSKFTQELRNGFKAQLPFAD